MVRTTRVEVNEYLPGKKRLNLDCFSNSVSIMTEMVKDDMYMDDAITNTADVPDVPDDMESRSVSNNVCKICHCGEEVLVVHNCCCCCCC